MKKYAVFLLTAGLLIEVLVALTHLDFIPSANPVGLWGKEIPGIHFATSPPLTGWDDARLSRLDSESDLEFSSRISTVIHSATYHCDVNAYSQNPFVYIGAKLRLFRSDLGLLTPSAFRCGFCHQRAFLLAKALRRGGVSSARILLLNGHVITTIDNQGTTYALDADYGVGPLRYDGQHDDEIIAAYKAVAPPVISNEVIQTYLTRDDNRRIPFKLLEKAEQLQFNVIQWAQIARPIVRAIGFICLGAGLVLLFRQRARVRSAPSPLSSQ